jgi:hypothetical protein
MIWKKLCFTAEAFPEKERTRELNQATGGALLLNAGMTDCKGMD